MGASPAAQNPSLPSRIDPQAQQLLNRALQALGGPAFVGVKSLSTRGRVFAIYEGVTSGFAPFESYVEFPDKRRFSYGQKKPVVLVNDGDHGWQLDRYGMIRQRAEQIRRWQISNRYSLENFMRLRTRETGVLIQDGGVDFVQNHPARAVELFDAQQVHAKLYLHQVTFLPLRISYRLQNPQTREWEEYADEYADYRTIQGIQTPMHITRYVNGERVSEIFRHEAQYNETYPPNYFQPVG